MGVLLALSMVAHIGGTWGGGAMYWPAVLFLSQGPARACRLCGVSAAQFEANGCV